MSAHGIALRAPWYVCERGDFDRFDPRSEAPAIQKYDRDDFVDEIVRDPSASLQFDRDDRWSFAMPRPPLDLNAATLRERLSPFRQVLTPLRKLYQPSHERFYAVTVELFCDAAGLPRPRPGDDTTVRFVVRRWVTPVADIATDDLRGLAKAAAKAFLRRDLHADTDLDVVEDLTALLPFHRPDDPRLTGLSQAQKDLLATLAKERVLQGWYVGADGRGQWLPVPAADDPPHPNAELELPMWRIPAQPNVCDRARTRSLWFGVVPTFSGDVDDAGEPRLDEHATYVIQCVARRPRPAPHAHCPPTVAWSTPTRPYRLAAFFDPAGNAHRTIRVKLPDFRAVAAHVGAGPGPGGGGGGGGVQFERPPQSQLPVGKFGQIPTGSIALPSTPTAEICSFSIELITIVAMFVLMLFLPVVVLVFGLWWLLLLKFCWPPSAAVTALISAFGTTAIDALGEEDVETLNELLGVDDGVQGADSELDRLQEIDPTTGMEPTVFTDAALGKELVQGMQPGQAPEPDAPVPTSQPDDPLC